LLSVTEGCPNPRPCPADPRVAPLRRHGGPPALSTMPLVTPFDVERHGVHVDPRTWTCTWTPTWTERGLKVSECGLDHPDGLVPIGGVGEGGADDRPVRLWVQVSRYRMTPETEASHQKTRPRGLQGSDPGHMPVTDAGWMDSCCSGIISTPGGDYLRTPGAGFSGQAPGIRLPGVGYRLPGAPKAGYRAPKTESGPWNTRP
jgi:hypothetical protein